MPKRSWRQRNAATNELRGLLGEYGLAIARGHRALREGALRVRQDAVSRRLCRELGGVGPLSASALRVKVAEPRDFANGRNFAAYLGLAPGHRGTGGEVNIGKLPKRRDRYVRQLLIHGARSVVSRLGDKQDAQSRWLRGLVARRGFNVACVALAHRNARCAWAIMARQTAA
jgi:transposase